MNTNSRPVIYGAAQLFLLVLAASVLAANRPNILLIVSEDNGPELGCYGEPYVQTPMLDKLAADGVRFHNAYVPQAGCSQSRAAYLTGLYPHQNGQIGLATWKFRMYREATPNIVRSLKEAGYRTGIIGKLHVTPESAFPFDMKEIPGSNFGRKKLGDYAKRAGEFMRVDDDPFFLTVNYPDAHRPFIKQARGLPHQPLAADDVKPLSYMGLDTPELRAETADYYNCLSRLDSLVGDLLAELQDTGQAADTIVIYFGDHGADLLRGKRTSYEGGVRVPLIIRWPQGARRGQLRRELVSTLDLVPTLLEISRAAPITALPGRSLLPLLRDEQCEWRSHLFTEFHTHSAHNFYPQRTVRDKRYKLIQNLLPGQLNPGYGFTLNRFFADLPPAIEAAPQHIREAYGRMRAPPACELYDLQADPYEFHNLAADVEHADVLAQLSHQLAAWRRRTNDPLLDIHNLTELQAEIDACFTDGVPQKDRLALAYPDYFHAVREDRSDELQVAETVLLYQRTIGGWPKNYDRRQVLSDADRARILSERTRNDSMIDNGATHAEIRLLAEAFRKTGDRRYKDAIQRGIRYLLGGQYDNGGWPQQFPNPRGYARHVTFNDNAMIGVMSLLRDVAGDDARFAFVPQEVRRECQQAVDRGMACILKCQIHIDGRPTVWCAQHDRATFEPRPARSYELASLSGSESVGVVRFLMQIEKPNDDVMRAIEGAAAWFERSKLSGIKVVRVDDAAQGKGYDKRVVQDPTAPPMWARFYDIRTNQPIYCSRDGVPRRSLAEISHERRNGYSWLGYYARDLLKRDLPEWRRRVGRD